MKRILLDPAAANFVELLMSLGEDDVFGSLKMEMSVCVRKDAAVDEKMRYVTYCGLYCQLCSTRGRLPKQASALKQTMVNGEWDKWGKDLPNFNPFWEFLTKISDPDGCPGCRQGGGPPVCSIRECAQTKGIDLCPYCDEFPCHRIEEMAKGFINLIPNMKRMKEVGFDAWLQEQQELAETGFCYCDIRCSDDEVPND